MYTQQTWAQNTFKISSSRPSSYFNIQNKNQVSYFAVYTKQAQARIPSFKKVQATILSVIQAKRESSASNIEQTTQNISTCNSTC